MFFYKLKEDAPEKSLGLQGINLYKDKWVMFVRKIDFGIYKKYVEEFEGEENEVPEIKKEEIKEKNKSKIEKKSSKNKQRDKKENEYFKEFKEKEIKEEE